MTDRPGIDIDCRPTCRGVWLDRGELDELIERSVLQVSGSTAAPVHAQEPSRRNDGRQGFKDSDFDHKGYGQGQQGQQVQRRCFWRELFV